MNNALRDKRIEKTPCEICGDVNVEAHHDDYEYQLNVRWLCFRHHRELHGQEADEDNYDSKEENQETEASG